MNQARLLAKSKNIENVTGLYSGYLPDGILLLEQYDGVFSLDVIDHIENGFEAVIGLKNLLAKDGVLIVTVPAYQWLWSANDDANHHFRRYTKKSFSRLLEAAGFKIRYTSYFNSILFPLAVLKRIIENFLPKKSIGDAWEVKMPSSWVNTLLKKLFELECLWAGKLSIPFGLSVVIVAELKEK
ncbi:MAG: methyltransferase domain-containing protein [Gammaproteobacteria bacterium]|nr:methyltransferase domain-containing protein [Gammaproteobacteria bacterium]